MGTFNRWGWIILMAVSAMLILFTPLPLPITTPVDRHMRIEASMFAFTPAEWTINPGDRVTVELVSTDVVHGLSLDGNNFELKADPGQTATGTFTANQSGVYRFRCSVPCGNLHPFMIGKLQVGLNLLILRGITLGLLALIAAIFSARRLATPELRFNP